MKPFRVGILHYAERVQEKHNLAKYLPPLLMKVERNESANLGVSDKELSDNEICVSINYILPSSMQDDLEDNQEGYCYLYSEDLCELLFTIKVKGNRKSSTTQINRLATSRAASNYDSNESGRVPCKKRASTCVIPNRKYWGGKTPNHNGIQRYCALCKKAGIPERKYMLHRSENCLGKRSNHNSVKEELGGSLGNRDYSVKHYKKYEQKWKKTEISQE